MIKVKVSEQPNNQMMKLFSLTAFGFLLATTTAFISKGPQYVSLSELNSASRDNMAPDQFCKTEIDNNEVIVFSKSYCPFCTKTKSLFDTLGVEYKVYELDQMNDGPELQAALFELSNQRSVPNVFIKQKHIGGNDDTQKLAKTGKLNELLGI